MIDNKNGHDHHCDVAVMILNMKYDINMVMMIMMMIMMTKMGMIIHTLKIQQVYNKIYVTCKILMQIDIKQLHQLMHEYDDHHM